MIIFGKTVKGKENPCDKNGKKQMSGLDNYVNLYVRLTNMCQADCPFCEFTGLDEEPFDFYRFYYVLHELKKQVRIAKVSFTGGEPGMKMLPLIDSLKAVKELDEGIFTVVSTNGKVFGTGFPVELVNSFALSRHAIGDNTVVFKKEVISDLHLGNLPKETKEKIHISCNLVKGWIDNPEKMYGLINHYSKLGFHDFGFVSLMPVNDFCKKNFVDFRSLLLEEMKDTIKTRWFNNGEKCCCANFLTSDELGTINSWYARYYCEVEKAENVLVYDGNQLKDGFNGEVILSL